MNQTINAYIIVFESLIKKWFERLNHLKSNIFWYSINFSYDSEETLQYFDRFVKGNRINPLLLLDNVHVFSIFFIISRNKTFIFLWVVSDNLFTLMSS